MTATTTISNDSLKMCFHNPLLEILCESRRERTLQAPNKTEPFKIITSMYLWTRLTSDARSEATHKAWSLKAKHKAWKHKNRNISLGQEWGREENPMEEWGTLPNGLKLLYSWARVHVYFEPQSLNRLSDNGTNHKLASIIFNLMTLVYFW